MTLKNWFDHLILEKLFT